MKLYEINEELNGCFDAETGEILDKERLDELQMAKDEKIENVALWCKELKAEAEALANEKKAFAERQRVTENKLDSLKSWLNYALGGESFKTTKASVSFRRSEAVKVDDLSALMDFDDKYVKYADPTPDKTAIKKAIKEGVMLPGCTLESNLSTIIK